MKHYCERQIRYIHTCMGRDWNERKTCEFAKKNTHRFECIYYDHPACRNIKAREAADNEAEKVRKPYYE